MNTLTFEDLEYLIGQVNAQTAEAQQMMLPSLGDGQRLAAWWSREPRWPVELRHVPELYYSIVKDRPLNDGNKRLALIITAACTIDMGFMPSWSPEEMYEIAIGDESGREDQTRILRNLATLVLANIRYVGKPRNHSDITVRVK